MLVSRLHPHSQTSCKGKVSVGSFDLPDYRLDIFEYLLQKTLLLFHRVSMVSHQLVESIEVSNRFDLEKKPSLV